MKGLKQRMAWAIVIASFLGSAGCGPPFPKQALEKVDKSLSFRELQKDPERYRGRWVMLAGMIVDVKNLKEGTLIEVLQKPMDSRGRPLQGDVTEGRFIVSSEKFLDAAVYQKGRELTVVGEVAGSTVKLLSEIEYKYPVLAAKDLYLWEPAYTGPRFFFGIGVTKQL